MRIHVFGAALCASALLPVTTASAETAAVLSQRDRLYDVTEHDDALFVVGHPGHLMRSRDGGKSFEELVGGQGDQALFSIAFNDKGQGAVVGRSGMYLVSEDGGDTWKAGQVTIEEEKPSLFGVDVLSDGTIVAVGEFGMIVRSEDRGKSFERIVYSIDEDLGTVQSEGEDGEDEGKQAPVDPTCPPIDLSLADNRDMIGEARLADVMFLDDEVGYAVGEFGVMLRTADGGRSFSGIYACTDHMLYNLAFDGKNHLAAVGYDGAIVESQDRGASWHLTPSGTEEGLYTISLFSQGAMIAGQSGVVLVRGPSGGFSEVKSGVYTWMVSSFLDDEGKGLLVGSRGQILRTEDGGRTFSPALGE